MIDLEFSWSFFYHQREMQLLESEVDNGMQLRTKHIYLEDDKNSSFEANDKHINFFSFISFYGKNHCLMHWKLDLWGWILLFFCVSSVWFRVFSFLWHDKVEIFLASGFLLFCSFPLTCTTWTLWGHSCK